MADEDRVERAGRLAVPGATVLAELRPRSAAARATRVPACPPLPPVDRGW